MNTLITPHVCMDEWLQLLPRVEALKLAISAVQATYNTTLYQRLHRKLQESTGTPANAAAAALPDVAVGAADQVGPNPE